MTTAKQKQLYKAIENNNLKLFNLLLQHEYVSINYKTNFELWTSITNGSYTIFLSLWEKYKEKGLINKNIDTQIILDSIHFNNFEIFKILFNSFQENNLIGEIITFNELLREVTYLEEENDVFFYFLNNIHEFDYNVQRDYCFVENLIIVKKIHLIKYVVKNKKVIPDIYNNEYIKNADWFEESELCDFFFSFRSVRDKLKKEEDEDGKELYKKLILPYTKNKVGAF